MTYSRTDFNRFKVSMTDTNTDPSSSPKSSKSGEKSEEKSERIRGTKRQGSFTQLPTKHKLHKTALMLRSNCDHCCKAKIKCSGGLPCILCSRRGRACNYSFKRKPGPRSKRSPVIEKIRGSESGLIERCYEAVTANQTDNKLICWNKSNVSQIKDILLLRNEVSYKTTALFQNADLSSGSCYNPSKSHNNEVSNCEPALNRSYDSTKLKSDQMSVNSSQALNSNFVNSKKIQQNIESEKIALNHNPALKSDYEAMKLQSKGISEEPALNYESVVNNERLQNRNSKNLAFIQRPVALNQKPALNGDFDVIRLENGSNDESAALNHSHAINHCDLSYSTNSSDCDNWKMIDNGIDLKLPQWIAQNLKASKNDCIEEPDFGGQPSPNFEDFNPNFHHPNDLDLFHVFHKETMAMGLDSNDPVMKKEFEIGSVDWLNQKPDVDIEIGGRTADKNVRFELANLLPLQKEPDDDLTARLTASVETGSKNMHLQYSKSSKSVHNSATSYSSAMTSCNSSNSIGSAYSLNPKISQNLPKVEVDVDLDLSEEDFLSLSGLSNTQNLPELLNFPIGGIFTEFDDFGGCSEAQ